VSVSSTPSTAPSTEARDAAPSVLRRAGTAIPVALLAGAVLGALAWLSDDLGYPTSLLIPANLVGVWGLVAFGAGAGARTVLGGAGRGLFALVAAVAVYYLAYGLLGDGWRAAGATRAAMIWGSVALLAEGLLFRAQVPNDPAAQALLTAEAVVGLALPLFLVRGLRARVVAVGAAVVVAAATLVGLLVVLPGLRAAADTF